MTTPRLPEDEYKALCKAILRRDGYKCASCGMRGNLCVHHIIFRSHRGPDEVWNLVTLCNSCHDGVHKDVKDGQYGLTVEVSFVHDEERIAFTRRPGWRPQ